MTLYRFNGCSQRATKSGKCPRCGRRVVRKQTFTQTRNPFNRNASGEVKTVGEIYRELDAECEAWVPDFEHEKCKAAAVQS